jgi:formylglycine-generating enzyme required for sulfatase activity
VRQFLEFRPDQRFSSEYSPTSDCPASVTWYDAAEYCNWLSKREGIPEDQWCYLPNQMGKNAHGMKPAADYLQRTGYRLPTEAEWEYACRAGSEVAWSFGCASELISKYAWVYENASNKSHPVGLLKPNGLGLFDMLGNAWEWCQEVYKIDPAKGEKVIEDKEDIADGPNRVLRGGAFAKRPETARSAHRYAVPPTRGDFVSGYFDFGFRPARTIR